MLRGAAVVETVVLLVEDDAACLCYWDRLQKLAGLG